MSLFLLGQLIYGIDLLSVREAVRLSIIIIGGYYGYRHVNNLPFNGLAFLIFVLYFVSITFHPNVAIISNIFAATNEFNHSYHYYRSVIPGGLPATSGYIIAFILIWGMLELKKTQISVSMFLITSVVLLSLIFFTQSRLPLVFSFIILLAGPFALQLPLKVLGTIYFSYAVLFMAGIYNIEHLFTSLNFNPARWLSGDTADIRIENIYNSFDIVTQEMNRIFPGCLFVRECHYDGTWVSITPDGAFSYMIMNWGLLLVLMLVGLSFVFLGYSIKHSNYMFILVYICLAIIGFLDPIFLDPKVAAIGMITMGYLFRYSRVVKYG